MPKAGLKKLLIQMMLKVQHR